MSSITKHFIDTSSFVYQAVLHVLLRDFTNYYWYKELEQQSRSLPETQDIKATDEGLDNVPVNTEESYCNTTDFIDVDSSIDEKQINKECSHETGDKYSENRNFNTPTRCITAECTMWNLGVWIQREELESNCTKETCYGKNKTSNIFNDEDNRYFGSDLSEPPDELKGTSLKQNLSYTVVAQKPDGDSLTYKILNNENYLRDTSVANPASTSGGTLEKQNGRQENLIPRADNKYESLNDLTVCFKDFVSIDPPKTTFGLSPGVSDSITVYEGTTTELRQMSETPELNHSTLQNPMYNSQHEKYAALKTNSIESLIIKTGSVETKSCEETCPTDSIWNIEIVQEKIQNLLSALTSNVVEKSPDENIEPGQKLSYTSYDDSDDGSDNESYDELVRKVFRSGPKSVGEISQAEESCCTCTTGQSCLQVVEFDEAEDLLTGGQMSSVDTGSVSDWLYSVTPAICLPSTSFSTIKTSGKQLRIHEHNILTHGKHSKYQDEIISKTLFTDKWVDDTNKYCKP